jgi:hypothetical protein
VTSGSVAAARSGERAVRTPGSFAVSAAVAIPAGPDDLTAEWFTSVLAPHGLGPVVRVERRDLGTGIGILAVVTLVELHYADGAHGPATLVVKTSSPAPENVFLCQAMGFYDREVSFYRERAASVRNIRVPRAYHADIDPSGAHMVVVIEHIGGATCPNQLEGLSPEMAGRIVDTIAGLHAEFWNAPALETEMTWLPPMNNPLYKGAQQIAQANWDTFASRFAPHVPADAVGLIRRVTDNYPAVLDAMVARGNMTFTHTDCRAENYLFGGTAGDDAITVLDFQLATRFYGVWDIANLLAGSITPEVRRQHEQALLERYHGRLVELGVTGYDIERLRFDYRACLLLQGFSAAVTASLDGSNERGAELLFQLQLRPTLTMAENDCGPVLDALLAGA